MILETLEDLLLLNIFNMITINKSRKIVVTDSGLGGVNIAANILENAKNIPLFDDLEVVFFNALPKENFGYNSINDYKIKTTIFNNALYGMHLLNPDLILIACNTLSVVYYDTQFYKNPLTNVNGIIELGVNLILDNIKLNDGIIVILGTPTTIMGNNHKKLLLNEGIKEDKIITQACKNLESEIQKDASSQVVKSLIKNYIMQAVPNPSKNLTYYILLGCTHYEYSLPIFHEVFDNYFANYKILNPNETMVQKTLDYLRGNNLNKKVSANVISKTIINKEDLLNVSEIINNISPQFAKALLNYTHMPNAFSISELEELNT